MSAGYQVIIKVEAGAVGHAFMTLVSPNQPPITIGYYPVVSRVEAPGIVKNDGTSGQGGLEHAFNWSKSFSISPGQYVAMLAKAGSVSNDPGVYGLLGNQCTEFVQDVLKAGGVLPTFPGTLTGVGSHPTMLIPAFSLTPENQVLPFRGDAANAGALIDRLLQGISGNPQRLNQYQQQYGPSDVVVPAGGWTGAAIAPPVDPLTGESDFGPQALARLVAELALPVQIAGPGGDLAQQNALRDVLATALLGADTTGASVFRAIDNGYFIALTSGDYVRVNAQREVGYLRRDLAPNGDSTTNIRDFLGTSRSIETTQGGTRVATTYLDAIGSLISSDVKIKIGTTETTQSFNGAGSLLATVSVTRDDEGSVLRTTAFPSQITLVESLDSAGLVTGSVRESPNLDGTRSRLVTTSVNGVEVVLVQTNTAANPTVFTTVAVQVDGQDAVSADAFASFIDGRYADPVSYLREAMQRPAELQGVVGAADPNNATGLTASAPPRTDTPWWNDRELGMGVSLLTSGIQALLTGKPSAMGLYAYNLTSSAFKNKPEFVQTNAVFGGLDAALSFYNFAKAAETGSLGRTLETGVTFGTKILELYQAGLLNQINSSYGSLAGARVAVDQYDEAATELVQNYDGASEMLGAVGTVLAVYNLYKAIRSGDTGQIIAAAASLAASAAGYPVVGWVIGFVVMFAAFYRSMSFNPGGAGEFEQLIDGTIAAKITNTDSKDIGRSVVTDLLTNLYNGLKQEIGGQLGTEKGIIAARLPTIEYENALFIMRWRDELGAQRERWYAGNGTFLGNNVTQVYEALQYPDSVPPLIDDPNYLANIQHDFMSLALEGKVRDYALASQPDYSPESAVVQNWEARTAFLQTTRGWRTPIYEESQVYDGGDSGSYHIETHQVGWQEHGVPVDPLAGRTSLQRAAANGLLLASDPGNARPGNSGGVTTNSTQAFRPIAFDLDGANGLTIGVRGNSAPVMFDVDDDGFAESTDWVGPRDGILAIDRNGDGKISYGSEVFSHSRVDMQARAFSVLRELDANGDNKLTSVDFVFEHLRIWRDFDRDGRSQGYELLSLSSLDISEIDFVNGSYLRNGELRYLTLAGLTADSAGFVTEVSENGRMVISETGYTHIDPFAAMNLGSAVYGSSSADGVLRIQGEAIDGLEDVEVRVSASQLLSNDSSAIEASLSIVNVGGAVGGAVSFDGASGVITYVPNANFFGEGRFTYTVRDSQGREQQGTTLVGVIAENDAPQVIENRLKVRRATWNDVTVTSIQVELQTGGSYDTSSTSVKPGFSVGSVTADPSGITVFLGDAASEFLFGAREGLLYLGYGSVSPQWRELYYLDKVRGQLLLSDVDTAPSAEKPKPFNFALAMDGRFGRFEIDKQSGDWTYTPTTGAANGSFQRDFGRIKVTDDLNGIAYYDLSVNPQGAFATTDELVISEVQAFLDKDAGARAPLSFAAFLGQYDAVDDTVRDANGASGTDPGWTPSATSDGVAGGPADGSIGSVGDDGSGEGSGDGDGGTAEPIILDLNSNGFRFIAARDSTAFFDMVGDDARERTAWTSGTDGILAFDANNDGKIDQRNEIRFTSYVPGATTDMEGLAAFDSNGDGKLSSLDAQWNQFYVWRDANEDGFQTVDELARPSNYGIVSINMGTDSVRKTIAEQLVYGVGSYTRIDGSVGQVADVRFNVSGEGFGLDASTTTTIAPTSTGVISAGTGNDTIHGSINGDTISAGSGNDSVDGGDGNDIMFGDAGADTLLGEQGDDQISGGKGADLIAGGAGSDVLHGDEGNDQLAGESGDDRMSGGEGDDILRGDEGNDKLYGDAGNDLLSGGDGDDWLLGGSGRDVMVGGKGNDVYVVGSDGDQVVELANEGEDTVVTYVERGLDPNIENMVLGGYDNLDLQGNSGNNILLGNQGDNVINGGAGADRMAGGAGNDTYYVDNANDQVIEFEDGKKSTVAGFAEGNLIGASFYNFYGHETFTSGAWGYDTVKASISYRVVTGIEKLELVGTGDINATGNTLANLLVGNVGHNRLDGYSGADTMIGGKGNDTYVVDNLQDITTELAGEGTDTTEATVNGHTLQANIENLTLSGRAFQGSGNELDNVLTANEGVENTHGFDVTRGSILNGLGGDDRLIGSRLGDVLDGGDGNDFLDGGTNLTDAELTDITMQGYGNPPRFYQVSRDTLIGGTGDDTYVVDLGSSQIGGNGNDTVIEYANEGHDTIHFAMGASWSLQTNEHVEDIVALRSNTEVFSVSGNDLANKITIQATQGVDAFGLDGDDLVISEGGSDRLWGGIGFDTFYGGGGDDSINDVDLSFVDAGSGNDTIHSYGDIRGGLGNDSISDAGGFQGQTNTYRFAIGDGHDSILVRDWAPTAEVHNGIDANSEDIDTIAFDANVLPQHISLSREANHLVIHVGANDSITVQEWFGVSSLSRIERFTFAGGVEWNRAAIASLVVGEFVDSDSSSAPNIYGWFGHDVIDAGDGADNVWGFEGNDILKGGNGNDTLYGQSGNDELHGGNDNDLLFGDVGNDRLFGDSGDDWIYDSTGDNVVSGGQGNDGFMGYFVPQQPAGINRNTYEFGRNDGTDTVYMESFDSDFIHRVRFAQNILRSDVDIYLGGDHLYLSIVNSDDVLIFTNWNNNQRAQRLEQLEFGDGSVMSALQIAQAVIVNRAPVLVQAFEDQLAVGGLAFSTTLALSSFADPDAGDTLSYSATLANGAALPSGFSFNGATGVLSGQPTNAQAGDYQVKITATDTGGLSASGVFTLSIANRLVGTAAANTLNGTAGRDYIEGLAGNDTLDGKAGADILLGGLGNDTYIVDNGGDKIIELVGEGTDTVKASVSYTLSDNVEAIILTGNAAINGTGNSLANSLTGNAQANALYGLDGSDTFNYSGGGDTFYGGLGNDTYKLTVSGDTVVEYEGEGVDVVQASYDYTLTANVESLLLMGTANINGAGNDAGNSITGNSGANLLQGLDGNDTLRGMEGNDRLEGGSGNDSLDGGLGADIAVGGLGNDTYKVDDVGDTIIELADEGTDAVTATVTYTLSANVENLTLSGTTSVNGTGNALANVISGNAAANFLVGLAGNDTLKGLEGNDRLEGGEGNDSLDGGLGGDTMLGGLGNDTYTVDSTDDVIIELADEGTDIAYTSVSFVLSNHLENLTLIGTGDINGSGNELDNVITGNATANYLYGFSGNDKLDGKAGADTLVGGVGDDTYTVEDLADKVIELAGEGTDTVNAYVTWTLSANTENLKLLGASAIDGFGNELNNTISGNSADNQLFGFGGDDILQGGSANDYLSGGDGADNLKGSDGVDVLFGGAGNDTLDGGADNDLIHGDDGVDGLYGSAGADIVLAGRGNDTIDLGFGDDLLAYNLGDGNDVVRMGTGFVQSDVLSLGGGIRYQDLKLSKTGNNLVLNIASRISTVPSSTVTLQNWYADSTRRNISVLQVVTGASGGDYVANSNSNLTKQQVVRFDFAGLVAAFDQARGNASTFSNWAVAPKLESNYLGGSSTEAIGGNFAWRYATQATVDGMLLPSMRQQLVDFSTNTTQLYQQTGA